MDVLMIVLSGLALLGFARVIWNLVIIPLWQEANQPMHVKIVDDEKKED
jgi:hypothetical protein